MHQKCTTALSTTNSLLAEITQGCIGMHSVRHQMIKSDALDKRLYTVAKYSKTSGKNCEENHCRQVKDVKIDDFVEFSKCVLHCWTFEPWECPRRTMTPATPVTPVSNLWPLSAELTDQPLVRMYCRVLQVQKGAPCVCLCACEALVSLLSFLKR